MINKKILVVDDETTLCDTLRFNLELEGYEVDTAYSAEEALAMDLSVYSLVLLDVMMGEISGWQMARIMKGNPRLAGIPIIFCTAKDSEDDMVAGLDLGADDYIQAIFHTQCGGARQECAEACVVGCLRTAGRPGR